MAYHFHTRKEARGLEEIGMLECHPLKTAFPYNNIHGISLNNPKRGLYMHDALGYLENKAEDILLNILEGDISSMRIESVFPLINDISDSYVTYRRKGKSRAEACEQILMDNENELSDSDDGPLVWIGIAKATGRKKELTQDILQKAEQCFGILTKACPEQESLLMKNCRIICDPLLIGDEARYIVRKPFKPDWQIGDTFMFQLSGTHEKLERLSSFYKECDQTLEHQVVLVRKAREALTRENIWEQLVYLSICDERQLPNNDEEMNALGYIPSMKMSKDGYEFKFSIRVKSQKALDRYQLIKIGCYPLIVPPENEVEPHAMRGANPLMVSKKADDLCSLEVYAGYYLRYGLQH